MEANPVKADIGRIEHALREAGVPVGVFCERVGINRATWQRWKSGKSGPLHLTWTRVLREAARHVQGTP
jgi:hypothetical protein